MSPFSSRLRQWRSSRRFSQAQLAAEAEISTRHLSFLETGRAQPSRQMVLLLGSALELDLRERNALLLSAGFAPVYGESGLDPERPSPLRRALDLMLRRQEPYGAVAVDRLWNVLTMNEGAMRLLSIFLPDVTDPRVATNLLHATFHPDALRRYMLNWDELAHGLVARLHQEHDNLPAHPGRRALMAELARYPGVPSRAEVLHTRPEPFLTVHLRRDDLELRLFTVLSTIGTPLDVSAQELSIETWYPADEASDAALRALQRGASGREPGPSR